ncbi:hypothetical protein ACA910_011452 [Epithemia clementina (nom. ined.)]
MSRRSQVLSNSNDVLSLSSLGHHPNLSTFVGKRSMSSSPGVGRSGRQWWIPLLVCVGFAFICFAQQHASIHSIPPDRHMLVSNDSGFLDNSNNNKNNNNKGRDWDDGSAVEKRWKPIDCNAFLQKFMSNRGQDPNEGRLYARYIDSTSTNPFWISLHNQSADVPRWIIFDLGCYYEKALTKIFADVLMHHNKSLLATLPRVIDVGGNVGWFTLLSASMNYHVDVFEPLPINQARICQSMTLNGWTTATEHEIKGYSSKREFNNQQPRRGSINIRPYAIGAVESDSNTMMYLRNNPGSATMTDSGNTIGRYMKKQNFVQDVSTRTLDQMAEDLGWFASPPTLLSATNDDRKNVAADGAANNNNKIAILKIDIEGNEVGAVQGAQRLLQSDLVQNLFMEVTSKADNRPVEQMLESIVLAGFDLIQWGRWSGPDTAAPAKMATMTPADQAKFIVTTYLSKNGNQVNLWYKNRRQTLNVASPA